MKTFSNTSRMDLDLLRDALNNYAALIQEVQKENDRKLCYLQLDNYGNTLPVAPVRIEDRISELIAAIDTEMAMIKGGD